MKALKKWLREWLQVEEETRLFIQHQRQLNVSMSMRADNLDSYADILRARMNEAVASVQAQAAEGRRIMELRAPKPLWRRYSAEHVGEDYGRIASAAAAAAYPQRPMQIEVRSMHVALREPCVFHHYRHHNLTGWYVAIQHIDLHPHHHRPLIDFGETKEQALFNLRQQLVQVALHEGWTLVEPKE